MATCRQRTSRTRRLLARGSSHSTVVPASIETPTAVLSEMRLASHWGDNVNLRIACKILKRHSAEVRNDRPKAVPPRLLVPATRRHQKWIVRHRIARDFKTNPAPSDLHLSKFRTRRCQPKAELLAMWKNERHG